MKAQPRGEQSEEKEGEPHLWQCWVGNERGGALNSEF